MFIEPQEEASPGGRGVTQDNDFPLGQRFRYFKAEWATASKGQNNVMTTEFSDGGQEFASSFEANSLPVSHSQYTEDVLKIFLAKRHYCGVTLKFFSRIFTVPKAIDSIRLALVLSELNSFLDLPNQSSFPKFF